MKRKARPSDGTVERLLCLEAISEVLDQGRNLSESVALQQHMDARSLALARHWAYGILRWQVALDWLSGKLLSKPLKSRDHDIRRLLWLGLFQLWQDRTPDHAAIHATAECARRLRKDWAVGLLNAVLRRFQREQETLLEQLAQRPEALAHPAWLLQQLQADWPEHWRQIALANNQQAGLWLRVNRRRSSREDAIERLQDAGFEVGCHPWAPWALCVRPAAAIEQLPGFDKGQLSVQDPAAQLAAGLLQAQSGMRVLDACAAPGGKTSHLLEMYDDIELTAVELHPSRAVKINHNLKRLGLACSLLEANVVEVESWWDTRPFDRILLDAPCSASGVIRRHPEIRHLRTPAQVQNAVTLQAQLLRALWPVLAPGGMLVYATCSVLVAENSNQIGTFLQQHPEASEVRIESDWGQAQPHGRQILPGEQDMDGFYYACLRKPV